MSSEAIDPKALAEIPYYGLASMLIEKQELEYFQTVLAKDQAFLDEHHLDKHDDISVEIERLDRAEERARSIAQVSR